MKEKRERVESFFLGFLRETEKEKESERRGAYTLFSVLFHRALSYIEKRIKGGQERKERKKGGGGSVREKRIDTFFLLAADAELLFRDCSFFVPFQLSSCACTRQHLSAALGSR